MGDGLFRARDYRDWREHSRRKWACYRTGWNLYVTSVLGSTISVINPESGEIVKTYGSDDGVIGPDDVDFFQMGVGFGLLS